MMMMKTTFIVSLSWSGYGLYRVTDNEMFEDPEIREDAIAAVSDYDRFEEYLELVNEFRFRYDESDSDTTFEDEKEELSEGIVSCHLKYLLDNSGYLGTRLATPEYKIGVKYLKLMDPLTRKEGLPCTYDPFIGFLIDAAELHYERYVNYQTNLDDEEEELQEEIEEKAFKRKMKMMNKEKMKMIMKNKKKMPHLLTEEEANKKRKRAIKAEEKKRLIDDYEVEKKKLIVEAKRRDEARKWVEIQEDRKNMLLMKKEMLLMRKEKKKIVDKKWRKLAAHSSTLDSV